jgi:hypothetical protein
MEIGIILYSPFKPLESLKPNSVVELDRSVQETIESVTILEKKTQTTASRGFFTRVMQTVLGRVPFGHEANKTVNQEYYVSIDSVCRRIFESSAQYVARVEASESVQSWLRQRNQRIKLRAHLFLVTGLLIANGAHVYFTEKISTAVGTPAADEMDVKEGRVDHPPQRHFLRHEDAFVFGIRVSRLEFGGREMKEKRYVEGASLWPTDMFDNVDMHRLMGVQAMDEPALQELFEHEKR